LKRRTVIAFALAAALAGGCRREPKSGIETIKIGEVAALTGNNAGLGQFTHLGVQLAVEDLNAAGGIFGRPIELKSMDTRSEAGETATATRSLITRDEVVAMVGEGASGRCLEGAQVAQQLRTPVVTPTATSPKVTAVGDEIFRVCFTDPFQGRVMARFARNDLHAAKAALLVDASSEYSVGLADVFRREFAALGGVVCADYKFGPGDKDFRASLTAIRGTQPDVLFAPCYYGAAGLIALQARELGMTQPLLGGDGWEAPELVEVAGKAADNAFFPVHFTAQTPSAAARIFAARFEKRFGRSPTGVSALAYDAVQVIAAAIRTAGKTDRDAVREALAGTKDFAGITGVITIDEERNARKPAAIIQVVDGRFKYLTTVLP
jgi:branched-chain amino acid transport system substrate-binding protein